MSFGINGPDNNLPAIQKSHQTNDGGAGNLGYFQQGQQQQKKRKQEELDVFESSSKKDGDKNTDDLDNFEDKLDSIGTRIKKFWLKLFNSSDEDEKKAEDGKSSDL